ELLHDQILEWPGVTSHHDQSCNLRIGLADARSYVAAQAVAEDEYAPEVDVAGLPEQSDGSERIVRNLLLQCWKVLSDHLLAVDPGSLVVAHHGDAAGGKSPRQIAKGLVAQNRLVPIVRSRAVNQHHGRKGPPPGGNRQRARQLPRSALIDLDFDL